jgi:GDP-mannose 4,6 dehydratase
MLGDGYEKWRGTRTLSLVSLRGITPLSRDLSLIKLGKGDFKGEEQETMKKALITGITGQDGSYLSELLLEKDMKCTGS